MGKRWPRPELTARCDEPPFLVFLDEGDADVLISLCEVDGGLIGDGGDFVARGKKSRLYPVSVASPGDEADVRM